MDGIQMGWLINPDEQSVFIYLADQPTAVYDQPNSRLPVPDFASDLDLTVTHLFSWLME
jgi:Uma2 family endonuclease